MRLIKWLKNVFNPPYQLILIGKEKDIEQDESIYIFKQYGSHDFVKVAYKDILSSNNLLCAIHPLTLIEIGEIECVKKEHKKYCGITKAFKNNEYEISIGGSGKIYSGDYICNNIDIFHNINPFDLCRIAYDSGFLKGRRFSKQMMVIAQKKVEGNSVSVIDNVVKGNFK